jgi:hypothetical protein
VRIGARLPVLPETTGGWWLNERSPFFDREDGVYPVYRVPGELGVPTAPWSPTAIR